jgi:hypothetical protein
MNANCAVGILSRFDHPRSHDIDFGSDSERVFGAPAALGNAQQLLRHVGDLGVMV